MKIARHCILIVFALSFSNLAASVAVAEERKVKTEKEFGELVVGRNLVHEYGTAIFHEDGRLTGAFRAGKLTGLWNWTGDTYCRTGKIGRRDMGYDCQTVSVSGNRVTFVRNNGTGRSVTYKMESVK